MDVEQLGRDDFLTLYEQVVSSVDEVCSLLDDGDWDAPTDCPGWSVKDNLSHLTDYEATAVGRPRPDGALPEDLPHVRNDFGRANEIGVHVRRARIGREVLEEFREVTMERLAALRAQADWDAPVALPFGEMPMSQIAAIRILDLFCHEQDIRRATGHLGHMDGEVARFVFERLARVAAPRVVAKAAEAPDGSVVAFEVGAPARPFAIRTADGRGAVVEAPDAATVRLTTDPETFLCLFAGRWSAARAVAEGRLKVEGDPDLAKRVLDSVAVVP